jgi:hypothetical protein
LKSSSVRTFVLEFWEERGEELMICHLFLDNFFEISWPLGCFQRLRVLKQSFVSWKLEYLNFDIMKYSFFFNLCLFVKDKLLQKLDCVFVLAIRGLLHVIKNFVLWCDFCVLITVTESFLKSFSFREIMVLSKTCVRFRNRIFKRFWMSFYDQIVSFPVTIE